MSIDGLGGSGDLAVASAEDAADSPVMRSDGYDVDEGTVLIDPSSIGLDEGTEDIDGKTVTVDVGGDTVSLKAVGSHNVPLGTALVSGADEARIVKAVGGDAESQTWVKIADDASGSQIEALTSELESAGAQADADPAQTRAEFASMFRWR